VWYAAFLERVAVPVAGRMRGMPVASYRRSLEESQWWSPEEIRALQWRKLKPLIEHAYAHVPYYRDLMQQAGVTPDDIRGLEDLCKVPISTKEQLRAAFPDRVLAQGSDRRQLLLYSSSGSTGTPFHYYVARREKAVRWAVVFRYWKWAGLRPGVPYINLSRHAPGAFRRESLLGRLETRLMRVQGLPVLDLWAHHLPAYLEEIRRSGAQFVRGYPSAVGILADALARRGETIPLRGVLTFGEMLPPHQRALIEKVFACKVYDAYGGEAMEVAAQCGHHRGFHVNAESTLAEVVDADGDPVLSGTPGQVVLTNLENYAMPFIRYNIQDVGTLSSERCSCGRGLPLLDSVEGRLVDVFVTPQGRLLLMHNFSGLIRTVEGTEQFEVIQESPSEMRIRLAVNDRFQEAGRQRILEEAIRFAGPGVQIALEVVDHIPPTPRGKRRFFISRVAPEEVAGALGDWQQAEE